MEVFFNELCLDPTANIKYADITRLGVLHNLLRKWKISGCRMPFNRRTGDLYIRFARMGS